MPSKLSKDMMYGIKFKALSSVILKTADSGFGSINGLRVLLR